MGAYPFESCETGTFVPAFRTAAMVLIQSLIRKGHKHITLDYLYDISGCETDAEKQSVRNGVWSMKTRGILAKGKKNGVYSVPQNL